MNVVLQKDLFERSYDVFQSSSDKFNIKYFLVDVLDENQMLMYHSQGVNCFVIGAEAYSSDFYNSLRENSLIIRYGVGYGAVPVDICQRRKILVAYTPGTLTDSVAEYTMGLILSLARYIPVTYLHMKENKWNGYTGIELKGKTLAVLGYGQIGKAVARIAKHGFGMKIHAFDKYIVKDDIADLITSDYELAVKDADVVSLHMAVAKDTVEFINQSVIEKCKDGFLFINTSRGCLVDEKALFFALKSHKIGGAAIDVFTKEPYLSISSDIDFRLLDNVITTPHCGSNTVEASNRIANEVIRNIIAYENGDEITIIPELKLERL